jgi:hypothetical protein
LATCNHDRNGGRTVTDTQAVLYSPPPPDVLEHFAYEVCQGLGENFSDPDVVYGLAGFLKVITQAQAKALNRKPNGMTNDAAD